MHLRYIVLAKAASTVQRSNEREVNRNGSYLIVASMGCDCDGNRRPLCVFFPGDGKTAERVPKGMWLGGGGL